MRRRAPAEARETLPRLSWRARFLTIGIGGSVDGERPRDGTCVGDKNARPGVSKGRFWRIVFSSRPMLCFQQLSGQGGGNRPLDAAKGSLRHSPTLALIPRPADGAAKR